MGSDSYEIKDVPGKGRGLFATKDIQKGAVILVDQPYEATLETEDVPHRSFYTFEQHDPGTLLRCAGCKFARYRTKLEQAADWKQGHKEECKGLRRRAPNFPGQAVRMVARILWKSIREKAVQSDSAQKKGADFSSVLSLMTHWEDLGPLNKKNYADMATVIRMYMDPQGNLTEYLDSKLIATLFSRLSCYGFTITDASFKSIGIGMFTLGGLANHDCRPNAGQTYVGKDMYLRAIRDIRVGEEILVSYVPCTSPKQSRRRDLLERYFFDIYSPQERRKVETLTPVSRKYCSHDGLVIECNVWGDIPWELDDRDQKLVEVALGKKQGAGETPLVGCGLTAELVTRQWEAQYLKDVESQCGYTPTERAAQLRDPNWRETELHPISKSTENPSASGLIPRQPADAVVNVWGPAFHRGDNIAWETVNRLARLSAAYCVLAREHNMSSEGQASMTSGQWWLKCKEADDTEKELAQSSNPVVLGPFHILRNDYIAAKFDAARMLCRWEAAYSLGSDLRPFRAFMQPVCPVDLMLMDAAMARFCMLLGKNQQGCVFARSAIKQMQLLCPGSAEMSEMRQVHAACSVGMRKSNLI